MKNLTTGSPTKLLLGFTVPLLIGALFQQLYQITDTAVVGRVIGVDGLAAVGAVGSLIFLLLGFGWGSTAGLAIPVSKAFGAGDLAETRRTIAAGAVVTTLIGLFITAVGFTLGRPILHLMGTPDYLIDPASGYLHILVGGAWLATMLGYLYAVLRAVGDAKNPLYFGTASQLLNAGLSLLLVAQLGLGISGAAVGTLLAQGAVMIVFCTFLARRYRDLIPSRQDWRDGLTMLWVPARTGLPMGLQTSAIAIGVVIMQGAVNSLGSDSMAAYAASGRIEGIVIAPLHAFNMAVVTFVAQNRGAEQWARIRRAVSRASLVAGGIAVGLGAIQFFFAPAMVGIFLPAGSGAPIDIAITYLRITAGLFTLLGLKFVMRGAVQGMGNSATPTASTLIELGVRSAVAFGLVSTFGMTAIALASPLAWVAGFGLNFIVWRRLRAKMLRTEQLGNRGTPGGEPPAVEPWPNRVRTVALANRNARHKELPALV